MGWVVLKIGAGVCALVVSVKRSSCMNRPGEPGDSGTSGRFSCRMRPYRGSSGPKPAVIEG